MEDWVKLRSTECSLQKILKQLEIGANSDAAAMNEAIKAGEYAYKPSFSVDAYRDRFAVVRQIGRGNDVSAVDVWRTEKSIEAKLLTGITISAIPRINTKGECVLVVADKELALWQFRQQFLEDLLFGLPS